MAVYQPIARPQCHLGVILTVFIFGWGPPLVLANDKEPCDRDLLQACLEGYLANREAFEYLECEFLFKTGRSPDKQKALEGVFSTEPLVTFCRWVVDKDKVLFIERADPAIVEQARAKAEKNQAPDKSGSVSFTTPVASWGNLADKDLHLSFGYDFSFGMIHRPRPGRPSAGVRVSPFCLGTLAMDDTAGIARHLKAILSGRTDCNRCEQILHEGKDYMLIDSTETGASPPSRVVHWLSPEKGFLPVYREKRYIGMELVIRSFWPDIRKVSRDRWFPFRGVVVDEQADQRDVRLREVVVTHLEVNKRPPKEAFFLDLPPGGTITEVDHDGSFKLKEARRVYLEDLPGIYDHCMVMAALKAARKNQAGFPWYASVLLIFLGICLVALGIWKIRTHFRRKIQVPGN